MVLVRRGFLVCIHKILLCYSWRVRQTGVMINSSDYVVFQNCGNKPCAVKVLFSHACLQTRKEKADRFPQVSTVTIKHTHPFSDLVSTCHWSEFFRSSFLKHINPCVLDFTVRKQKRIKQQLWNITLQSSTPRNNFEVYFYFPYWLLSKLRKDFAVKHLFKI